MNKIEKRTNKILESFSPTEYVMYEIRRALGFSSWSEWLLDNHQHWDDRRIESDRVLSAFRSRMEKRYSKVVAELKINEALFESAFVRQLWDDCNRHIREANEYFGLKVVLLSERQLRASLELKYEESTKYSGEAAQVLEELLHEQFTIAAIRHQYFKDKPILFKEYDDALGGSVATAESGVETDRIIATSQRGAGTQAKVDISKIRLAAQTSANATVQSVVTLAKARTHMALGENVQALRLVAVP